MTTAGPRPPIAGPKLQCGPRRRLSAVCSAASDPRSSELALQVRVFEVERQRITSDTGIEAAEKGTVNRVLFLRIQRCHFEYRTTSTDTQRHDPYELRDSSDDRDEEALASIRAFLEEFGVRPTAEAWTATGMTPSEKTIRRRFGSFRSAVARANAPALVPIVPKSSTAIAESRL